MSDEPTDRPRPRIRMPIEDRVPPEEWITEVPDPAAAADREALAEAERRRKEFRWGYGG